MSPRKTRLAAKAEGADETMPESITKKAEVETPAESQPRRRTRRQLIKSSSAESEVDQSLEMIKSGRKIVPETPSSMRKSRKKLVLEVTVSESTVVADVPTRRTRKVKENDTLTEQSMLLDSTSVEDSEADKSRGTRARKKVVKKSDPRSEDEATEAVPNERINASAAINVTVLHEDVTSSDAAVPMSIEDAEVHQVSSTISRAKATATTPGRRRPRNAKITTQESTPESSPITVNLTPHRTTKTPRKSPTNLGSPKSHADTSLRLSKTPRKLPIVSQSPAPSEKSVISSPQGTPVKSPIPHSSGSAKSKKKHRSPESKRSSKSDRKSPSQLVPQRKFSKSPKIVLRSPKAKSTKKKSPRVVASKIKKISISKRSSKSPSKSTVSPKASSSNASVSKKSLTPKRALTPSSPKEARASLSPKKARASLSPKKPRGFLIPRKTIASLSPGKTEKSMTPKKRRESLSPTKTERLPSSRKQKKSSSPKKSGKLSPAANLSDSPSARMAVHLSRVDSPTSVAGSPTGSNNLLATQSKPPAKSPKVVLTDIAVESVDIPETGTRSRRATPKDESLKSTPVQTQGADKLLVQGNASPRRPKSIGKKRGPITDSGTPLRPIVTPRCGATKPAACESIILSSSCTPVDIAQTRLANGGRILSSTPRERIRRSLNLSPGLGTTLGIVNTSVHAATPSGSSTLNNEARATRRSIRIEDESNPLISEDETNSLISEDESGKQKAPSPDKSRLNGTFEVDATVIAEKEEGDPANGTYELDEPKTPKLRRRVAKRSLAEVDTSIEERPVKRTCRVRFASPSADETENQVAAGTTGSSSRSRLATPGQRARPTLDSSRRGSENERPDNNQLRRRSNSMSNSSVMKTPIVKRRSNSVTGGSAKSISRKDQNASANRLSKPRLSITSSTTKKEVKTPVARKAPNFAEIHQRKFAQMESLVDAKKRVAKRHLVMTSKIPSLLAKGANKVPSPKPVPRKPANPNTAVNGDFNRYGFKLRKNDAVSMVTQKQPKQVSDKKLTENRTLLKGVRTNRRFDLIMKARNINQ